MCKQHTSATYTWAGCALHRVAREVSQNWTWSALSSPPLPHWGHVLLSSHRQDWPCMSRVSWCSQCVVNVQWTFAFSLKEIVHCTIWRDSFQNLVDIGFFLPGIIIHVAECISFFLLSLPGRSRLLIIMFLWLYSPFFLVLIYYALFMLYQLIKYILYGNPSSFGENVHK